MRRRIIEAGFRAAEAGAIVLQAEVKKTLGMGGSSNRGNGGRASSPGGQPAVNTGTLRRSIQIGLPSGDRVAFDGRVFKTAVGTRLRYARVQEFGGMIAAKGGLLTIPIHAEAKRASAQGRSARSFSDAFIVRTKKQLLIVRNRGRGKGQRVEVLYVLKSSVRLPARPYFRPSIARARTKVAAAIANVMRRSL
jgi:hypothetical protein